MLRLSFFDSNTVCVTHRPFSMPTPPVEPDLAQSDLTDRIGHALSLRHQDIDLASFVVISSDLYRSLDIRVLLLVQAQLQDGPLLEGRLLNVCMEGKSLPSRPRTLQG